MVDTVDNCITTARRPASELLDAATCSTDRGPDCLTGLAELLMSPVPERRAEGLLELLHLAGTAEAALLTAVDADGRHLVVAARNHPAWAAASIAGRGRQGRIPGAVTRSLVSASGEYVGALHVDISSTRPVPGAVAALDLLTPHVAAVATMVSRRSRLGLTRRERDVLCAVAAGYTNAEISQRESVSVRTVTTHVESIFRKLGVRNRVQAARVAIDCGLDYSAGFTAAQGLAAS
jgi:DNA-binding CsgD family transcriptional regulator